MVAESYNDKRKYLALIAHNNMKASLMEFCSLHAKKLEQFPLIATGTTGSMLYTKTGLCLCRKVASGPAGRRSSRRHTNFNKKYLRCNLF
jgi:methylglyoxal synthase